MSAKCNIMVRQWIICLLSDVKSLDSTVRVRHVYMFNKMIMNDQSDHYMLPPNISFVIVILNHINFYHLFSSVEGISPTCPCIISESVLCHQM